MNRLLLNQLLLEYHRIKEIPLMKSNRRVRLSASLLVLGSNTRVEEKEEKKRIN